MGQRANLIVIESGHTEVFYTHWRANTLPRDLFWGPTYGLAFAKSQLRVEKTELLDEVWGEGGAVIDIDRHMLLLFGGEDISYDVPLRRLYLRLLAITWPGWQVQWAYEGVCDLADAIGVPRQQVLAQMEPTAPAQFRIPEKLEWTETVATAKLLRGPLLLFPIQESPQECLSAGPAILEMNRSGGISQYRADGSITGGGFHIDEGRHSIEIWTASDAPNITRRVSEAWPEWSVTWYQDRFEFQIDRSEGRFRVDVSSQTESVRRLREILLVEERRDAVDAFLQITERMAQQSQGITRVNPRALRDAWLLLSIEERTKIVDDAIAAL